MGDSIIHVRNKKSNPFNPNYIYDKEKKKKNNHKKRKNKKKFNINNNNNKNNNNINKKPKNIKVKFSKFIVFYFEDEETVEYIVGQNINVNSPLVEMVNKHFVDDIFYCNDEKVKLIKKSN